MEQPTTTTPSTCADCGGPIDGSCDGTPYCVPKLTVPDDYGNDLLATAEGQEAYFDITVVRCVTGSLLFRKEGRCYVQLSETETTELTNKVAGAIAHLKATGEHLCLKGEGQICQMM